MDQRLVHRRVEGLALGAEGRQKIAIRIEDLEARMTVVGHPDPAGRIDGDEPRIDERIGAATRYLAPKDCGWPQRRRWENAAVTNRPARVAVLVLVLAYALAVAFVVPRSGALITTYARASEVASALGLAAGLCLLAAGALEADADARAGLAHLDRVADQVPHHLLKRAGIAGDARRLHAEGGVELDAARVELRTQAVDGARDGDARSVARLISLVEEQSPLLVELARELARHEKADSREEADRHLHGRREPPVVDRIAQEKDRADRQEDAGDPRKELHADEALPVESGARRYRRRRDRGFFCSLAQRGREVDRPRRSSRAGAFLRKVNGRRSECHRRRGNCGRPLFTLRRKSSSSNDP